MEALGHDGHNLLKSVYFNYNIYGNKRQIKQF